MYWLPSSRPEKSSDQTTVHQLFNSIHSIGESLSRLAVTVQHLETALSRLTPHFSALGGLGFHAGTAFSSMHKVFDSVAPNARGGGSGGFSWETAKKEWLDFQKFKKENTEAEPSSQQKQSEYLQRQLFKLLLDQRLRDVNISEAGEGSEAELRKITAAMTEAQIQSAKIVSSAINGVAPDVKAAAQNVPGAVPSSPLNTAKQGGKAYAGTPLERDMVATDVPLTPEELAKRRQAYPHLPDPITGKTTPAQLHAQSHSASQEHSLNLDPSVRQSDPKAKLDFSKSWLPIDRYVKGGKTTIFPAKGGSIGKGGTSAAKGVSASGGASGAAAGGMGAAAGVVGAGLSLLASAIPLVVDGFKIAAETFRAFVSAASPDAWSTLTGSMELLAATIGRDLIPITIQLAKTFQDAAALYRVADPGSNARKFTQMFPTGGYLPFTKGNAPLLSANQFRAAPSYTDLSDTYKKVQVAALGDDPITAELKKIQSQYLQELVNNSKTMNQTVLGWLVGGQR